MAQTLVSLYVHIIFSTKHRQNIILPEDEPDLFAYMGGIANNDQSKLLAAGGTANPVHLLTSLSKNIGLSEFVGDVKRDSSVWIKDRGTRYAKFHWQDGYGAFSVGYTQLNAVKRYIARQKRASCPGFIRGRVSVFSKQVRSRIQRAVRLGLRFVRSVKAAWRMSIRRDPLATAGQERVGIELPRSSSLSGTVVCFAVTSGFTRRY